MIDISNIREKAVRYIGLSKKTEAEVRKKIKSLGADGAVEEVVLASLKESGYINDTGYVEAYIRQNEKMQNYSILEIKQHLSQKGIHQKDMLSQMQDMKDSGYELKVINKLLNGKLKGMEEKKKQAYLYRRGFQHEE